MAWGIGAFVCAPRCNEVGFPRLESSHGLTELFLAQSTILRRPIIVRSAGRNKNIDCLPSFVSQPLSVASGVETEGLSDEDLS